MNENPYSPPNSAVQKRPAEVVDSGSRFLWSIAYAAAGLFFITHKIHLVRYIGYSMLVSDAFTLAAWTVSGTLFILTAYFYMYGNYRRALFLSNSGFAIFLLWGIIG